MEIVQTCKTLEMLVTYGVNGTFVRTELEDRQMHSQWRRPGSSQHGARHSTDQRSAVCRTLSEMLLGVKRNEPPVHQPEGLSGTLAV